MATGVTRDRNHPFKGDVDLYKWTLVDGETGDAVVVPLRSDKTVHCYGDFDASGDILIEGSTEPEGTDFFALHDAQGGALNFTSDAGEAINEGVYRVRPRVVAGTAISVNVALMVKR